MQAKELRIGNYIYDDERLICIINGFSPFDNCVRCNDKEGCNILVDYDDKKGYSVESFLCNPIPLNRQWLIKLGFIQSIALNNYWSEDEIINIIVTDSIIHYAIPINSEGEFSVIKRLDYVHQLQNIYFDLKGKELVKKI